MKRWDSDRDGAMDEYEDGRFVLYEDAAELQRQLAEVTKERDTLRAMRALADERINRMLAKMKRYFVSCESGGDHFEDEDGEFVLYADLVKARALIKKVLEDAGPVENRDETIRQIMEILK